MFQLRYAREVPRRMWLRSGTKEQREVDKLGKEGIRETFLRGCYHADEITPYAHGPLWGIGAGAKFVNVGQAERNFRREALKRAGAKFNSGGRARRVHSDRSTLECVRENSEL